MENHLTLSLLEKIIKKAREAKITPIHCPNCRKSFIVVVSNVNKKKRVHENLLLMDEEEGFELWKKNIPENDCSWHQEN